MRHPRNPLRRRSVLVKTRLTLLTALAVAITVASVAAASPDAVKQRIAISAKNLSWPAGAPGQFDLTPLTSGALKRDSGTARVVEVSARGSVMRQGQSMSLYDTTFTYKGKWGMLTIRERIEWVDVSNENAPGLDYPPGVALGTWKVVRGTGQYARIAGGGRTAHAGMGQQWLAREEGFVTRSS
jgi:hypothetical protein